MFQANFKDLFNQIRFQVDKIRQDQDSKDYSQIDETTFAIDQLLSVFHFILKLSDQDAKSEKASSTKESVRYSRMSSSMYRMSKKEYRGSPQVCKKDSKLVRKTTGGRKSETPRKKSLDMDIREFVECQETPELTDNSKQRTLKQATYLGAVRATEECKPLKMSGRFNMSTDGNLVLDNLTEKAELRQASQKPAPGRSTLLAAYFVGVLKSISRVDCS